MTTTSLTLKSFFADGETLPLHGAQMLEGLKAKLPGGGEALAAALEHAIEEVFQVQLGDVLQSSWERVDGLSEALKDSLDDPGGVAIIPLVDHAVTSTHSPRIDLFLGRKRLAELALEIELNLQLKGVALELRGGRIVALRSGECAGKGVCSMGGQALIERTTPSIPLPGRLAFSGRKDEPEAEAAG